jgi:phospholipase C
MNAFYRYALWFMAFAAVAACSSPNHSVMPPKSPGFGATPTPSPSAGPIKHIIFIVQENRTFDNIFGGPRPFPNATTAFTGNTLTGQVQLKPIALAGGADPDNFHQQWQNACNPSAGPPYPVGMPAPCQMNGFSINASPAPGYTPTATTAQIYSYVQYGDTKPYWEIASTYAVGDHFFMGHNSESYTGHQYIFSGQSDSTVDAPVFPSSVSCGILYDECAFTPWGCDSPPGSTMFTLNPATGKESDTSGGPGPCYGTGAPSPNNMVSYLSLADLVGKAGLTWRLYAHSLCANINALDANGSVRFSSIWPKKPVMSTCHQSEGIDETKVETANFRMPQEKVLTDVAKGDLANVTWVLPGLLSSDHPGVTQGNCGPWWVSNIVDAVGASPDWNSTAIFVLWDDWGGFYDHVPPYVVRDQEGPGFRVPLLVISPFVNRHTVVHTDIEFATLLKFAETNFNLGSLGATDASPYIHDLNDFFDFSTKPQPFTKIKIPSGILCSIASDKPRGKQLSRWEKLDGED